MMVKKLGENGKNLGNLIRAGTSENMMLKVKSSRVVVDLDDHYVTIQDVFNHKPNIRSTRGDFFIRYTSPKMWKGSAKFPYVIGQDLMPFRFMVKGPAHFRKASKYFKEVEWMLRNTYYKDHLFAVAKAHPGIPIYFTIDYCKLFDNVTAQLNAAGIDPTENKPFVSLQFNPDEYTIELSEGDLCPNKATYTSKLKQWRKESEGPENDL